jgi:hypothetical protein
VKIYGLMVTRNECDRYLQSCLAWHVPIFDGLLVYDDQSTDQTQEIALASGAHFCSRPDSVPTFMTHEGKFRQDSLQALEECFHPDIGDWVLVVDSDEFLVADQGDTALVLRVLAEAADAKRCKSVILNRPELWSLNPPAERLDGYWGSIRCTRLFRWEPGGQIKDLAMGCGNEPTYINKAPMYPDGRGLRLFHVGYVDPADRQEKYDRYTSLSENGHNDNHIKSILTIPSLRKWGGPLPDVWRGVR